MLVNSVHLEHVLSQVNASSRNPNSGSPFSAQVVDQRLHFDASKLLGGAFIPLLTIKMREVLQNYQLQQT